MRRLTRLVAIYLATVSLLACGSAAPSDAPTPAPPAATTLVPAPTKAPTTTPAPTPTSSPAATATATPEAFAGIWATPPLDWEDWQAAIEANGLDPAGAEQLIVSPADYENYVQFELEVRNGQWSLNQINDGIHLGVALPGSYTMSDADTAVVDAYDAECNVSLDLTGTDGVLRVDVADEAGDGCSENYDMRVQVAVYESAPYHLVEPAGGFVPDPGLAPSPRPAPSPAATPVTSTSASRYTPHAIGTVEGAGLGYTEYLPPDYDGDGPNPLLVFLHGSGESGKGDEYDLAKLAGAAVPQLVVTNHWPDERPFVVLSPQHDQVHPHWCFGVDEITDFLSFAMEHYDVDPARVYVTGLSCGAIGLWNYLGAHGNEVVAAAVPIAGIGYGAVDMQGCDLGQLPIWAFHGANDDNVVTRGSTYPMSYLADCTDPAPVDARLTVYDNAGHDVWTRTYNGSAGYDVFDWMLSHTK